MKKQKEDLRVIKTKKCLYEAILNIMKEKPFENIKVSDICTKACVNRSTFYTHFEDKYMLLDSLIHNLSENLVEELSKNKNISTSKEYYIELIKLLMNHMEDKKEIYMSIMINNRNSIAMDMVYDTVNEDITKRLEQTSSATKKAVPAEFRAKFYLGAIIHIGFEWLKTKNRYKREDIITYLDELISEHSWQ